MIDGNCLAGSHVPYLSSPHFPMSYQYLLKGESYALRTLWDWDHALPQSNGAFSELTFFSPQHCAVPESQRCALMGLPKMGPPLPFPFQLPEFSQSFKVQDLSIVASHSPSPPLNSVARKTQVEATEEPFSSSISELHESYDSSHGSIGMTMSQCWSFHAAPEPRSWMSLLMLVPFFSQLLNTVRGWEGGK